MPSYGGSNGPDGSKKSGDQGQGTRDSKGGQTGGAKDGGKTSGYGRKTEQNPQGITARHGSFGTNAPPESTTPGKADLNTAKAHQDYTGAGDSFLDRVGNVFGAALGFTETNPYNNKMTGRLSPAKDPAVTGRANWSWDPVQTAATAGSLFGGPIGTAVNLGYRGYKTLGGPTPDINMGPDVFGGETGGASTGTQLPGGSIGNDSGGGRRTTGILTAQPKANPIPQAQPATATPAPPSPAQQTPNGFPTPTEKYGQSGLNLIYDPALGRVVPRAA